MKLKKEGPYQICVRCIMDTTDPDIVFDSNGVCNHCHHYDSVNAYYILKGDAAKARLDKLINTIKQDGKGKEYDCIIGLSGGVDSSYVAWLVKQHGLRPLAVHLDNGWNSELAVQNVENIVNKLGLDLFTIVIDWEEFRDLQLAYLKSSVVDLEATSDHAIITTMYKLAEKNKIRYLINGTNVVTESILPLGWYYKWKSDLINIKDIYKKFGSGKKLKTFPMMSFTKNVYYSIFLNLKWVSILNYIDFNKQDAIKVITEELGWKNYGGKHHESVITKFYQSYILPKKTGFDKRRAHLSNLICSAQISRENALLEISQPVYKTDQELEADIDYVIKKFEITRAEFDQIISNPPRANQEFKTDAGYRKWLQRVMYVVNKFRSK